MTAYYNEIDPFAAEWLRNLIAAGHIAPGDVDERSIEDVRPDELAGYTQCHFFAGIGVWSYALRLAGWPDDRPVWTGSCPCPPFSSAGKKQACPGCGGKRNLCHPRKSGHFICLDCGCDRHADDRHLWPEFSRLIRECKAPIILGEQVASEDGRRWLDVVSADLQNASYGVAGADLCAAGIGAPHIRQRLWFVAKRLEHAARDGREEWRPQSGERRLESRRGVDRMGDPLSARLEGYAGHGDKRDEPGRHAPQPHRPVAETVSAGGVAESDSRERDRRANTAHGHDGDGQDAGRAQGDRSASIGSQDGRLADTDGRYTGAERQQSGGEYGQQPKDRGAGGVANDDSDGRKARHRNDQAAGYRDTASAKGGHGRNSLPGPVNGFWQDADWLFCRDDKWRPVEPGTFPLADGVAGRVGRLRAYGNAIVAQTAQTFIESVMDVT